LAVAGCDVPRHDHAMWSLIVINLQWSNQVDNACDGRPAKKNREKLGEEKRKKKKERNRTKI